MDRWATFDCYGTLVDWRSGMVSALESIAPGRSASLLEHYHRVEPVVQSEAFRPYKEVLAEGLRRSAAGLQTHLSAADCEVFGRTLASWPIYGDVGPALALLQDAGWKLAILSNVDRDLIAGTLANFPVPVELVVTAEDVGSYKPALGHFNRFMESTGVDHSRWVHIAVSMFHDIRPAKKLQVKGVYVPRDGEKEDPRDAQAMLPNLVPLPAVLEALVHA
jgi:2-haloacid dehalogenase